MRLDHQFTVPAPIDEVWQAVLDPERVAPCMPGASLTEVDGDSFRGTVKVKLGPISLTYKGTGEFLEKDEAARKVVIKASGRDAKGAGTASATVTLTLTDKGGSTEGAVATDLSVTGRPAQFGRGMITEVGGKILDSFATCLSSKLGSGSDAGADSGSGAGSGEVEAKAEPDLAPKSAAVPKPAPQKGEQPAPEQKPQNGNGQDRPNLHSVKPAPEPEAINLLDYAGDSVLKRLIPVFAGLAVIGVIVAVVKAIRS